MSNQRLGKAIWLMEKQFFARNSLVILHLFHVFGEDISIQFVALRASNLTNYI